MSNATKYVTMSIMYGGDWSKYSLMVNWFSKFMYHKFYHRLCSRSLDYWLAGQNTSKFREAIFNYVKYDNRDFPIPEMAHLNIETFRTMGFIDCMQLSMCQPGSGPVNESDEQRIDLWETQQAFYIKYGKLWGMKCQGVFS